jgi:site-specific DNA recombinase
MLVYIYTRVSSEEQARDGVSLAMQETACRELAASQWGNASVRLFCDDGYSAETLLRPALQEMLEALGEADVLVIWRQDRLLRHPRHLEGMMEMCATAGVRIVSTQGEIAWGNASERAFTRVRAVFSGLEVEQMAERISAALDHIAHEGRHPVGCPYGYRREGGQLVPHETQGPVVREVYERYAQGETLAELARGLTERGVPRRRGGTNWDATNVDNILRNPTHCGAIPWAEIGEDGRRRRVVLPGTHLPLVSVELWQQVQALRSARGSNHGRRITTPPRCPALAPRSRCGPPPSTADRAPRGRCPLGP